jgi:HEAT repeats/NACHT domain
MTSNRNFQDYLQSLCTTYKQWWEENAFIDEIKDAWFEFVLDGKTKSNKSADEQRTTDEQRQEIPEPVLRLIEDYRHQKILIVGDPGAGKSTLLKRLLRDAAEKAQKDEQAHIPVLVELKDYKTTGDRVGIRGLILENLESHDPALDEEALKQLLTGKQLLLLADGLNELSHEPAKAELKNLCRHQAIIATSRFANGWLNIDRELEIQPLTPQQVKRFLEERLPNRDLAEVEKLGERVRDFGQTPLMVWMLYTIFQENQETPTTRGESYRSFTALYVERAKTGIDLAESRFLLSKLAFEMMQSQKPDDPTHFSLDMTEVDAQNRLGSAKILNQLLNLHLLQAFGQPGNRKIRFCHQTLQEYYAAEALLEQLQKHPEWLEKIPTQQWTRFQQDYLNYVKWTEAIKLMLGLMKCEVELVQIVKSSVEIDGVMGERLSNSLKIDFHKYSATLAKTLNCFRQLKLQVAEEGPPTPYGRVVKRINPFLRSVTSENISVSELLVILHDLDPEIRSSAAIALAETRSEEAIPELLKTLEDIDSSVRWHAAIALGRIGSEKNISGLLVALEKLALESLDSSLRSNSVFILGKIGGEQAVAILLKTMRDPDYVVRQASIDALADTKSIQAVPILLEAWQDKVLFSESKSATLFAFEKIKSNKVTPFLLKALEDQKRFYNCLQIIQVLEAIHDPSALPKLMELQFTVEVGATYSAIKTIQSRCGFYNYEIYQYAEDVNKLENSSDSIGQLYKDIDRVIYQIERNPELRQQDGEDRLTIEIVGSLRSSGYSANHDCKIGGHVDLTVEQDNLVWLGEAKIYQDNNYLWEGFLQLTTRYSTGDTNQNSGGLLIYIFDENANSIMEKWQHYLLSKSLPDYSYKPCKMRSLAFISSHRHERSGDLFHVRHMPVLLHFAPTDKSARRRKTPS